ncbi:MAG: hypothetical protein PHT16_04055 [Candidatus Pacebacteria bacterium]|nr:hypothetical protein [Candidatus Paceibacterota bacterium]
MLPEKAIKEFKELYKKRYGVELSDQEASYRANNLFNLYKVTYMPNSIIEPGFPKNVIQ